MDVRRKGEENRCQERRLGRQRAFRQAVEDHRRARAEQPRDDHHQAQGQDQVKTRQGKQRDQHRHPQRVEAAVAPQPVKGDAAAFADVLRGLKIIKGVVGGEPTAHQAVGRHAGGVQVDGQHQGEQPGFDWDAANGQGNL